MELSWHCMTPREFRCNQDSALAESGIVIARGVVLTNLFPLHQPTVVYFEVSIADTLMTRSDVSFLGGEGGMHEHVGCNDVFLLPSQLVLYTQTAGGM